MATINGVPYDHASAEVGGPGGPIITIDSWSYGHEVELEKDPGATREDLNRTAGVHHVSDAEMSMQEKSYRVLIGELGNGYMMKVFPLSVSYWNTGEPTITDELKDCQIIKSTVESSKGPSPIRRALTLSVMRIKEGGLDPVNAG